ncbi:MAG: hypothetical protein RL491_1167 [Bacteroidota bacterium]
MKIFKTTACLLSVLLLLCVSAFQSFGLDDDIRKGNVALEVERLQQRSASFNAQPLFESATQEPMSLSRVAFQHKTLQFNIARTIGEQGQFPEFFSTEVPHPVNGTIRLLMYRVDIRANGFQVLTSSGMRFDGNKDIAHYRGIVDGDYHSVVSMTITPNEIIGLISTDEGNFVIGRLANDPLYRHIIYNDREIAGLHSYECGTNTSILANPIPEEALRLEPVVPGTLTTKCVDWYYETDYDIFVGKGSVSAVNTYIQGAYNQVATLYNNDGISTTLQTLFIWDTVDPYTGTTTNNYLTQFGQYRTSFAGDVAMLIGYSGGGGVAYVNGLCSSSNQYRMGYCAISSTYQNVPTYSWTVEVLTHEGGHLLGSRHTHDCVWNGNNTRIDGCGPAAGYNSGTCAAGPIPVSGTIMSYCHLVSGVGINFNNGFGTQPTSAIVNTINNAACLTACTNPCTTPSTPGTITVGGGIAKVCPGDSRTFSISAVSGATSYNWTPPAGATIVSGQGTTTINVSFGSGFTVQDSVRVAAVNSCGSSETSARIVYKNNLTTPTVISGQSTGVCASSGIPYSVVLDTLATSYTWSFSSTLGVVSSGQGTNGIIANFGTGSTSVTLSVTANNACGASSARTLSISAIPAQPGAITGTATPCANQLGVPYSIAAVSNATSYRWLVPSGSRIVVNGVTSSGTSLTTSATSILVNFKTSAGNVSVRSNNGCGSSAYRSLAITYPCRDAGSVLSDQDDLSVNPNIVSEQLQLQFISSSQSQVRISLLDINGRVVSVSNGELLEGDNRLGVDVSMLPQGIYSIQAEFNGSAKVARFIKQ